MKRMMLGLMAASLLSGCGGLLSFDIPYNETVSFGGGAVLQAQSYAAAGRGAAQSFQNQGVKPENVKSAKLKSFGLTVQGPAGRDLSFFSEVDVYAQTQADASDKKLIARAQSFAVGQSHVDLEVQGEELKPYVAAPEMSIAIEFKLAKAPPAFPPTQLELKAAIAVEAKL